MVKTPFPGHSECFVAVLLTSCQNFGRFSPDSPSQILGSRPSKSYTHFTTPVVLMFYACFFNVFYKSEKNMFFMFFIRKSMFLSSMRRPKRGNVHRMYPAKQPVACSLRIDRSLERHRAVSVTISITCTPLSGSECSDALIDV